MYKLIITNPILYRPDIYVRVIGRLHQFNHHIQVAANIISIIEDPNELTYHFLDTIYIHLTIGKLDVVRRVIIYIYYYY
jgi:hypothetical protein